MKKFTEWYNERILNEDVASLSTIVKDRTGVGLKLVGGNYGQGRVVYVVPETLRVVEGSRGMWQADSVYVGKDGKRVTIDFYMSPELSRKVMPMMKNMGVGDSQTQRTVNSQNNYARQVSGQTAPSPKYLPRGGTV